MSVNPGGIMNHWQQCDATQRSTRNGEACPKATTLPLSTLQPFANPYLGDFEPKSQYQLARGSPLPGIKADRRLDQSPPNQKLLEEEVQHLQTVRRVTGSIAADVARAPLLPTGEVIGVSGYANRGHCDGFPKITEPLPADIQQEDIIKNWPNHLWGPLLLSLAKDWTPREIGALNGAKLKTTIINRRIQQARKQEGNETSGKKRPRRQIAQCKEPPASSEVDKNAPSDFEVESEASRIFRLDQTELLEALEAKDPGFSLRQSYRRKRDANRDRDLVDYVIHDREQKRQKLEDLHVLTLNERKDGVSESQRYDEA